jgi:S-DNA-T family DNA segregation ATPase FtsK/SpoIIIE
MFQVFTGLSFLILAFNIPFRWFIPKPEQPSSKDKHGLDNPFVEASTEELPSQPADATDEFPDTGNYLRTEPEQVKELDLEVAPAGQPENEGRTDIELLIEKPVEPPMEEIPATKASHQGIDTQYDPTMDLSGYRFPGLELLNDYGTDPVNVKKEELEANKDKIVQTLSNYDIKISKIKATIGPAVTLYEIVPEAGIRISRIKNLEDDIALSLAAMGIRIIAPIPGKGTIGIEVPNQSPEIVSIKSLLATDKFKNSTYELPFVLGKTIANETFIADLARMPHLLMAGATGQGKSVGLNTIITSLLYKKHPAQIKFVLIDPKKVELTLYTKLERHFLAKLPDADEAIITDTKKVIRTLNSLNIEMDSRYDLLRDAQVRNIKEYNEKFFSRKLNPLDGHQFLPYIVIVIDEFADLIMTAGREIETPLARLAQLARATGIHLIIATQRPSVNIITGTIKANFPARIAFRVISKIDSRTILDSSGADQLIGRGDMLLSTGSDLIRLQCAFVDTPEIEKVTEFIGSQRGYPEAFALPEFYDEESTPSKDFDANEKDEFFAEAARLVVQHQHGSTSLIQRKLKLGYNRAGRIIDQLESAGIVGPFEGSKAREVNYKDLNSLEEHLNLLGK